MKDEWAKDEIKKLRAKTGLSIQKFADKYGIPFRTFQDWELGNRVPPDYVVDMLAKIVDLDNVNLTGWFFNEYRDKRGAGTNQMFATKKEALQEAKEYWDRLCDADKRSYIDDPCGEFYVAEFPLVWDEDELEYQPATFDYTPVWSAL
ncbi:helix-turn-helix transcriptional regulator [Candidatus Saccharibacteria bacterium]|nr:helix-turn-helix transcriptional regulator [Candidatus Saccharibacteria bacterium]